jgi:molybdopterin converting factor small subunit
MQITIKAYNEIHRFTADLPPNGTMDLEGGNTVHTVLNALGIPREMQIDLVIFRNGRPAGPETKLSSGDQLVIFAPMTGG